MLHDDSVIPRLNAKITIKMMKDDGFNGLPCWASLYRFIKKKGGTSAVSEQQNSGHVI